MHRRQQIGADGEETAAAHLRSAGYAILERNWRIAEGAVRGEIDIIAERGGTLAFVEVKTRRGDGFGSAADAVGWDKRRRLRRLAGAYLAARPHPGPVRGDVVCVTHQPAGGMAVTHLRGVW